MLPKRLASYNALHVFFLFYIIHLKQFACKSLTRIAPVCWIVLHPSTISNRNSTLIKLQDILKMQNGITLISAKLSFKNKGFQLKDTINLNRALCVADFLRTLNLPWYFCKEIEEDFALCIVQCGIPLFILPRLLVSPKWLDAQLEWQPGLGIDSSFCRYYLLLNISFAVQLYRHTLKRFSLGHQ